MVPTLLKQLKSLFSQKFWLFSAVLFLLLRLPSLFEPYWYGDEGIYLALGQGIRHGLELYSQIHDNKPPLLYFLAALSYSVFGFRLLLLIIMIPTLYYFYRLSLHFLNTSHTKIAFVIFLILTSVPFVEGNIANAEIFMLLPTLAAFYYYTQKQSLINLILVGFLLGIALTLKVPVFVEIGFLFLWTIFSSKISPKNIIPAFVLGFSSLLPILFFGIYYYFKNSFDDFLFASLLNNFGYLSSWKTGTHTAGPLSGGILIRTILLFVSWLVLFVAHQKKLFKANTLFLLGWFVSCIYGVLLSGRPYPHYLIQILPSLTLILVSIFTTRSHPVRALYFSSIIVLIALIIRFNFYFYPVFSYYSNFYSYLLSQKSYNSYAGFFGNRVNSNQQISQFIKSNSTLQDKIFVWGDEPYIYPLSDRLPAGRFLVAYHIIDFNRTEETMTQLVINLPKFIVVYPMSNRPFGQLDRFIANYYFPVKEVDNIVVYQRR